MTDHPPGPPLLLPGSIARVVCWAVLTDEETAQELAELTPWVTWLKHRYDLDHRTIPDCWPHHGTLIEELSALRTAWHAAYGLGARADAPLAWHTNLDAARSRLTRTSAESGCRRQHHRA